MCQSNAYLLKDNKEELILEDVAKILFDDKNQITLISLFGEEKKIKGELDKVDLLNHKIYIKSIDS